MNTWIFAATATQTDAERTFALAEDEGLIVRPFFDNRDVYRARNNNSDLEPGDKLVLVFTNDGQIVDSVPYMLTADHSRNGLSNHVASISELAGRRFPEVFSVFPQEDERFRASGYNDSMLDPKLRKWVCLSVTKIFDSIDEDALQAEFAERSDKYGTINRVSSGVFDEPSEGIESLPSEKRVSAVERVRTPNTHSAGKRLAMGIDFSGGKDASKKIWVAEGHWTSSDSLELVRLNNGFSFDELQNELVSDRAIDILVDFPFGLAKETCVNLGLSAEASYSAIWNKASEFKDASDFRHAAKGSASGAGSERAHKRQVDRLMKTPFSPINLRMFRQTFFGMAKVLAGASASGRVCFLPWGNFEEAKSAPRVGEGCPASLLKKLGWPSAGYKGKSDGCLQSRTQILNKLSSNFGLMVSNEDKVKISTDVEGDALDAVLLMVGAAHLTLGELEAGQQYSREQVTEGYIYLGEGLLERTANE